MTDPGITAVRSRAYWGRVAFVVLAATITTPILFGRGSIVISVIHGVVYAACIGGCAGLIIPLARHRVRGHGFVLEWVATLAASLVVAAAGTFLGCVVLGAIGLGFGQPLLRRFVSSFQLNVVLTLVICIAFTLYESQRSRLDELTLELRTKELERERDHKAALEARLSSLEARLHPHFLFNTLNAISELIHENPERAERTVERLAVLLRAALDATERGTVALDRELDLVRDYLEIEKTRFGDRLTYGFDIGADAHTCPIPPLSVQTLVENSIKHAIAPSPNGGRIQVKAATENGRLTVSVWDNGPGFDLSSAIPGHGLENLQSRLSARFGGAAALGVSRSDGGTLVTVSLPRA